MFFRPPCSGTVLSGIRIRWCNAFHVRYPLLDVKLYRRPAHELAVGAMLPNKSRHRVHQLIAFFTRKIYSLLAFLFARSAVALLLLIVVMAVSKFTGNLWRRIYEVSIKCWWLHRACTNCTHRVAGKTLLWLIGWLVHLKTFLKIIFCGVASTFPCKTERRALHSKDSIHHFKSSKSHFTTLFRATHGNAQHTNYGEVLADTETASYLTRSGHCSAPIILNLQKWFSWKRLNSN